MALLSSWDVMSFSLDTRAMCLAVFKHPARLGYPGFTQAAVVEPWQGKEGERGGIPPACSTEGPILHPGPCPVFNGPRKDAAESHRYDCRAGENSKRLQQLCLFSSRQDQEEI